MVIGWMIGCLITLAVLSCETASLMRRVRRLEEKKEDDTEEPVVLGDKRPDRLFCEWMYGGEE